MKHLSVIMALFYVSGWLPVRAGDEVRLSEPLPVGARYQVRIRVQLSGSLRLPAEPGKPEPLPLPLTGESAIDYDERILEADRDGKVNRAIRVFQRIDFERRLGDTPQKASLRPEVKRIVQVRMHNTEVPFSPDGPLTWGEIDLLRTDVFTPALVGLLPSAAVREGDRWKATEGAVRELTDLEQIDEGGIECRLERVYTGEGKRLARVTFSGTVRGLNEDGPTRQELDGYLIFDLDGRYLSYLSLNGRHRLLSPEGKESGRVEGRFVLSRHPNPRSADLSDEALRGVKTEPDADNTRLLYENLDLGLTFLHPRRWRVSGIQGRQVTLDSADGNGALLTVDTLPRIPTGAQYLAESRAWLEKQKARVYRVTPPFSVQGGLERFVLEADMSGQKFVMDYYIARQPTAGVTIAARLLPENLLAVQKEVEQIARSIRLR